MKFNSRSDTPSLNSTFLNVEGKDILMEYMAGKVTIDQTTGLLLDKVAKKSSSVSLLDEVKFFFIKLILTSRL